MWMIIQGETDQRASILLKLEVRLIIYKCNNSQSTYVRCYYCLHFCKTNQFAAINVRRFLSTGLALCSTLLHKISLIMVQLSKFNWVLKLESKAYNFSRAINVCGCVKIAKFVNVNCAQTFVDIQYQTISQNFYDHLSITSSYSMLFVYSFFDAHYYKPCIFSLQVSCHGY